MPGLRNGTVALHILEARQDYSFLNIRYGAAKDLSTLIVTIEPY